jgi:hypothetical protein
MDGGCEDPKSVFFRVVQNEDIPSSSVYDNGEDSDSLCPRCTLYAFFARRWDGDSISSIFRYQRGIKTGRRQYLGIKIRHQVQLIFISRWISNLLITPAFLVVYRILASI